MEEKILKFRDEHYKKFINVINQGNYFILENEIGLRTYPIKIIDFIVENDFLKSLDALYAIKISKNDLKLKYAFYLKRRGNKINIHFNEKGDMVIQEFNGGKWDTLEVEKKGLSYEEQEYIREMNLIAKKLFYNFSNNSKERIKLLLNK